MRATDDAIAHFCDYRNDRLATSQIKAIIENETD